MHHMAEKALVVAGNMSKRVPLLCCSLLTARSWISSLLETSQSRWEIKPAEHRSGVRCFLGVQSCLALSPPGTPSPSPAPCRAVAAGWALPGHLGRDTELLALHSHRDRDSLKHFLF